MKAPAIAFLLLVANVSLAHAEKMAVTFSSDHVAIGSDFTGAELTLFGEIEPDAPTPEHSSYDVIVIVRGPLGTVTLHEKGRMGPFWLNRASWVFPSVPGFLAVLSNRPVGMIIDQSRQQALAANVDTQFAIYSGAGDSQPTHDFAAALIRIRRGERLFSDEPAAVSFLSPSFFRTAIKLPGPAPLGHYDVDVKSFAQGEMVGAAQTGFWVNRIGIEHVLAVSAKSYGVLYGLAVVAMALSFGWIASVIFRRN